MTIVSRYTDEFRQAAGSLHEIRLTIGPDPPGVSLRQRHRSVLHLPAASRARSRAYPPRIIRELLGGLR